MMRKFAIVLLALLVAALFVIPVLAQDVTDTPVDPTAVPTVEVTPVVPPIVVVPPVETAPNYGLIATLITVALIVGAIVITAIRSAAAGVPLEQIDKSAAERVDNMRKDREMMVRLENAYASNERAYKTAVDTLANVITTITPFLGKYQIDDAIAGALKDIQTPGAPPDLSGGTVQG